MSAATGQEPAITARGPRLPAGPQRRRLVGSLLLNGAVPLLVYAVLRPRVGSDATALAIGTAVPVTVTAALLLRRRRVDPVGLVAVVAYGIALLIMLLSGGNVLVLELQDAVVTGPLGLAFLLSAAVRRPLHRTLLRVAARYQPRWQPSDDPAGRRASTVISALLGAMFAVHAAVLLVLALAVPVPTFLAISRPVGLPVLAAGLAVLLWYRRRLVPATSGSSGSSGERGDL